MSENTARRLWRSVSPLACSLSPAATVGHALRTCARPVLWCPSPPPLVWPIVCASAVRMDPQSLNIDSLLTAARMLEKGQLLNGFTALNISLPAAMNIPTSASDGFFQEFQENVQPSMSYGKLRHERKCSSASTSSMPYCPMIQRKAPTKTSRAAHNELEKTRRANLRCCLEKLKSMVPPVSDAARNTTLALLTRAKDYIQDLDVAGEQIQCEIQDARELKAAALAKLERLREEKARLEECVSRESNDSRVSPVFLEYSPSTKPSYRPVIIDPVAEGLLPALPISFPRPTLYPFFDLNPLPASQTSFLPIHLSV